PTVLVVDDGSVDETSREAAQNGGIVFRPPRSLGEGAALARGLRGLGGGGFSWGLTIGGGGPPAARGISKFLACATQCGANLLVGNRMGDPGGMPWLRRNVNRWLSRRLSHLAGQPLPDSQCGFRLFELRMWAALDLQTSHFETESEMLLSF